MARQRSHSPQAVPSACVPSHQSGARRGCPRRRRAPGRRCSAWRKGANATMRRGRQACRSRGVPALGKGLATASRGTSARGGAGPSSLDCPDALAWRRREICRVAWCWPATPPAGPGRRQPLAPSRGHGETRQRACISEPKPVILLDTTTSGQDPLCTGLERFAIACTRHLRHSQWYETILSRPS